MKCLRKNQYSEDLAKRLARDLQETRGYLRAYLCPDCYRWHLTSQPLLQESKKTAYPVTPELAWAFLDALQSDYYSVSLADAGEEGVELGVATPGGCWVRVSGASLEHCVGELSTKRRWRGVIRAARDLVDNQGV